jgi:hypothetical protein
MMQMQYGLIFMYLYQWYTEEDMLNPKKILVLVTSSVLLMLAVTACFPAPSNQGALPSPEVIYTQAAATIAVQMTLQAGETAAAQLTQIANLPVATATATPTNTVPATAEPTVTATASPTAVPPTPTNTFTPPPPTATSVPCNLVAFVKDVSIPDGTKLETGQFFTKTWRLQNIGACTWMNTYDLVFSSGDRMDGPTAVDMPVEVKPGQAVDITVNLRAPSQTGKYEGFWLLRDNNGVVFGMGSTGNKPFWVKIEATARKEMVYDMAAKFCDATWSTNSGVQACPGSTSSTASGYVVKVDSPQLETGSYDDEPALFVAPDNSTDGFISGKYPAFAVKSGDRFRAVIGCAYPNKNCYVQFELLYTIGGGAVQSLGSWDEKNEGQFVKLDIDLSSLAGKDVSFILKVSTNGNPADDVAHWLSPRIMR